MQIFNSPEDLNAALGPTVATIGKYDGMHLGHRRILDTLLSKGRELALPAVVILSEPQPEEFFSPQSAPPRLNHFQDKVNFLADIGITAVLCMNFDAVRSQQEAQSFVRDFLVAGLDLKFLVIGDDFRFGKNREGDFALLQTLGEELGFGIKSIAPCCSQDERVSSTLIREYLEQGNCQRAAQLLGRHYSISGEVVLGKQLGRQLGTPTANVHLQTSNLPMNGVFAVLAELEGKAYKAVANMGYKPTVSDLPTPSLEVHLFDFEGELYGQTLKVNFIQKIRDELKFSGLDALKEQIALDISTAKQILDDRSGVEQAQASEAKA